MTLIRCKKHGLLSFYEVCEHIDEEYKSGIYQEHSMFYLAEMYGILVCNKCWQKHSLDNFQRISEMTNDEYFDLDDEEANQLESGWSKVYNSVNRQVWCVGYVAEIQIKQARLKGEADPFIVYEKTLNSNQQAKIDELEKNLADNFQLQESLFLKKFFQPNRPALFLEAGGLRCPLTITIYYVKKENEQNEIIQSVEKILQQIEDNQAKIQFFEAENLIITQNQLGGENCERGKENLLREVYLNC